MLWGLPQVGWTLMTPSAGSRTKKASTSYITSRCEPLQLSRSYVSYCQVITQNPSDMKATPSSVGAGPIHVRLGLPNNFGAQPFPGLQVQYV